MKSKNRARLPRGLHRKSDSPYIWFSWRDSRGKQHRQSTATDDPVKAFAYRAEFMEKRSQDAEEAGPKSVEMSKLPLRKAAAHYFGWKEASSSANTVARERALFKTVASFFGATFAVGQIRLHHIRDYQRERKLQASRTRKQPISGRSVNYEMHLLRSVMKYANCWSDELDKGYQPLREIKKRAGKVATSEQLKHMILKAMANEYWRTNKCTYDETDALVEIAVIAVLSSK